MEENYRDWLTIREFKFCYPLEYLEYLDTFEYEDTICVKLDENAIKKIDLLIKKDEEIKNKKFNDRIEQNPTPIENLNPKHENIFCNNGFILFEYILNEYVKPKGILGRYEDISYYYRRLFEDKFIHQKSEPFRVWFIEKYDDEFTKIKTIYQVAPLQRNKDYSNALDWFKTQNY